MVEFI